MSLSLILLAAAAPFQPEQAFDFSCKFDKRGIWSCFWLCSQVLLRLLLTWTALYSLLLAVSGWHLLLSGGFFLWGEGSKSFNRHRKQCWIMTEYLCQSVSPVSKDTERFQHSNPSLMPSFQREPVLWPPYSKLILAYINTKWNHTIRTFLSFVSYT